VVALLLFVSADFIGHLLGIPYSTFLSAILAGGVLIVGLVDAKKQRR
jgi:hypothetical protein